MLVVTRLCPAYLAFLLLVGVTPNLVGATAPGRSPDFDPPPPPQSLGKAAPTADLKEVLRPAGLPLQPWFVDEAGRQIIPNGVVLLTEDSNGDFEYPEAAFTRLRRYGLNLQVVRLSLARLGGFPGAKIKPEYFDKLDRMVRLGAQNGVKTIFKLTLYDHTGEAYTHLTEDQWATLFLNRQGAQDMYLDAWERMFRRYAREPDVWGYDLLNEPLAGSGGSKTYVWERHPELKDVTHFETKFFWPLYERVIDRLQQISPEKWALVQSWHYIVPDHRRIGLPSAPPSGKLSCARTAFAPHYYGDKPAFALDTYLKQSVILGLPIIIGEYGPPTFPTTDQDLGTQLVYQQNFMRTVELFDRHVVGVLKAWYSGSGPLETKAMNRTWAMFTGKDAAQGPERKYVVDVMCRPRPLQIAGVVESFRFDFATRRFSMAFVPGQAAKPSEIYLPLDRFYPEDGLRVKFRGLVLGLTKGTSKFTVLENSGQLDPSGFSFDAEWQRLRVRAWPGDAERAVLEVVPGTQF